MLFAHVEDDRLRKILEQELTDSDSLDYALTMTGEAIRLDGHNEDVDHKVHQARLNSYEDAEEAVEEDGDAEKAIKALQLAWSV